MQSTTLLWQWTGILLYPARLTTAVGCRPLLVPAVFGVGSTRFASRGLIDGVVTTTGVQTPTGRRHRPTLTKPAK